MTKEERIKRKREEERFWTEIDEKSFADMGVTLRRFNIQSGYGKLKRNTVW